MDNLTSIRLGMAENEEQLTDEEKLQVAANLLGYKVMPVDIETFIESPHYLGNIFGDGQLYPYWKKKLKELFPDPIHINALIVVLTGAIGTGKSTFSRICSLYLQHKIDCLRDPYKTLGIARGKSLNFVFFHTTGAKAQADFVDPNNRNKEESPYFNGGLHSPNIPMADVVDGQRSNNSIGGDTIFQVLSELNFVPRDTAEYKLDQAVKRIQSRFLKVVGYFILIIIDTSTRGDDTIADDFIKSNPFGEDQVMVVRASIWEAKAHLNLYFRKGSFWFYAGDSTHSPFIVEDPDKEITMEMDRSRLIKAPKELESSARYGLKSFIEDQAGMSTKSSGKLFDDPDKVRDQFNMQRFHDEVLTVNFYNKSDKLIYQLDRSIREIPTDKVIFPRYDLGVTNDCTGIAITYFDQFKFFDSNQRVKMPVYRTPVIAGLSRKVGEETSLYHLFEFIMDLAERFEIGEFTADQFASRQMMQDLEREGIKVRLLSVDRTDSAYIYWKNMISNGLWFGEENPVAVREACELSFDGHKYDHPKDGSKDICDAICGSVYSCYENLDTAIQLSKKYRVETQNKFLQQRMQRSDDVFKDMLQGIYG